MAERNCFWSRPDYHNLADKIVERQGKAPMFGLYEFYSLFNDCCVVE